MSTILKRCKNFVLEWIAWLSGPLRMLFFTSMYMGKYNLTFAVSFSNVALPAAFLKITNLHMSFMHLQRLPSNLFQIPVSKLAPRNSPGNLPCPIQYHARRSLTYKAPRPTILIPALASIKFQAGSSSSSLRFPFGLLCATAPFWAS